MSLDGKWVVESLAIGGELNPPLEDTEITLEVEGDRVGGIATINRFMGSFADDGGFGPLATTMMAGPPDLMAQEHVFLALMEKIDTFEVDSEEMRLVSEGLVLVTLRRSGTDRPSKTSNT